uniref:Uncharacterized protein n=1 Tax=Rhizophora mucronata TaxID=61149 RepID=A0A2P2MYB8_RHIMU
MIQPFLNATCSPANYIFCTKFEALSSKDCDKILQFPSLTSIKHLNDRTLIGNFPGKLPRKIRKNAV